MNPVVTSDMDRWSLIAGGKWWKLQCPATFELWSIRRFWLFGFHNKEHWAWEGRFLTRVWPRCCQYCGDGALCIKSVIYQKRNTYLSQDNPETRNTNGTACIYGQEMSVSSKAWSDAWTFTKSWMIGMTYFLYENIILSFKMIQIRRNTTSAMCILSYT